MTNLKSKIWNAKFWAGDYTIHEVNFWVASCVLSLALILVCMHSWLLWLFIVIELVLYFYGIARLLIMRDRVRAFEELDEKFLQLLDPSFHKDARSRASDRS